MTLSQRNFCLKWGILISALCLLLILTLARKILPLYPYLAETAAERVPGIVQAAAAWLFAPVPQAPFATMTAAVLYALITALLSYFFFEKTHSPEITFFAFFALSCTFEILRIMAPLRELYDFPSALLIWGAKILLFGRFFGVLSLFASSVYAAGLDFQKQGNIALGIALVTLIVALGVPIDGMSWDTSLTMISGYSPMFHLVESVIMIMSVLSFLVGAYIRGTREYLFVALGALLVSLGRNLLIGADTWAVPLVGLALLAAGTWFITGRLHQVYLWL
jgi:hypothetical protein